MTKLKLSNFKLLRNYFKKVDIAPEEEFLHDVSGIIHVGANAGLEYYIYRNLNLSVIWVEPIPDIFDALKSNIRFTRNQTAIQALVTDQDGKEFEFNIANNDGASSSIFKFKRHNEIWPEVNTVKSITLEGITLPTLFKNHGKSFEDYQALILDTQGSELMILEGSVSVLKHFKYIKTEVADFEAYEGCCTLDDMDRFMARHGFIELNKTNFASQIGVGNYYDIVYRKKED